MKMSRIIIVGAGNLGRRHLQGALKVDQPLAIAILDPSERALNLARVSAKEVKRGHPETQLSFINDIEKVSGVIDAAIIATSANVRLAVLQDLYRNCCPHSVLLEKLLFQDIAEYAVAHALLGEGRNRVWVNTARRVMYPHHRIRDFFDGTQITSFTATGGLWGLGTSFIHLLDILDFYQPGPVQNVSVRGLDDVILQSKRAGFREITGTLTGQLGSAVFNLTSSPSNIGPLRFFIEAVDRFCVVEENEGRAIFSRPQVSPEVDTMTFRLDYISETTTRVLKAMLNNAPVGLPSFEDSMALHMPLLAAIGPYFATHLGTSDTFVPLT